MGITEDQVVAWAIAQSEQEHDELLTHCEDKDHLIPRAYLGEVYLGGLFWEKAM